MAHHAKKTGFAGHFVGKDSCLNIFGFGEGNKQFFGTFNCVDHAEVEKWQFSIFVWINRGVSTQKLGTMEHLGWRVT